MVSRIEQTVVNANGAIRKLHEKLVIVHPITPYLPTVGEVNKRVTELKLIRLECGF